MEPIELYKKAIERWGERAQLNMLYEEVGELLTAISRLQRGRASIEDVVTEIADVSIMCEQMAVLFGYDKVVEEKERKLLRLHQRLEKYNINA